MPNKGTIYPGPGVWSSAVSSGRRGSHGKTLKAHLSADPLYTERGIFLHQTNTGIMQSAKSFKREWRPKICSARPGCDIKRRCQKSQRWGKTLRPKSLLLYSPSHIRDLGYASTLSLLCLLTFKMEVKESHIKVHDFKQKSRWIYPAGSLESMWTWRIFSQVSK